MYVCSDSTGLTWPQTTSLKAMASTNDSSMCCLQADLKAQEDADSASKIDPKHALITLVAGLTVRYYLMDIIKIMVILAILLGDASFVTALFARWVHKV